MIRPLRILSAALAAVIGLALLAAWLVPQFLDWDHYRDTVEHLASARLGRPVRIDGPIRLSLLPQATLMAGEVALSDTGDGVSADAAEIRLRISLAALLSGRVEPQDLVLSQPSMRLPWPLATPQLDAGYAPAGLHARIEDGTLWVGHLKVSGIDGELAVDPATGTLSSSGLATVFGRPWRMTGRLGRPGADGSSPIEVSLDGQGPGIGTGGALSGQLAADGSLAGRVSGRGPDLSLLLPAPAHGWRADGRLVAGSGLIVADDLELDIGGIPARGAVALRLLPQLRLDAALATSRLDLDAWLAPLLHGGRTALPTGIDLSAEAATLAGGTLRRLRAGFELTGDGVTLRELQAIAPGDASVALSGALAGGHFTGAGRLDAPDFPATMAWLRPVMPSLVTAMPAGALRSVNVTATVAADAGSLALGGMQGDVGGVKVAGDVALHGGARPALAAALELTHPTLDRWLPDAPDGLPGAAAQLDALQARFAGFDADVSLTATEPVWHGRALDHLDLELRSVAGAVDLQHATLAGPAMTVSLSGSVGPGGRLGDGRLELDAGHAEAFGDWLPPGWGFARNLFRGPGKLLLTAAGPPGAVAVNAMAELSDARGQFSGSLDLVGRAWSGAVSLHHPGAPRMLGMLAAPLGLPDPAAWLGDGSLSFQAGLTGAPDRVALSGIALSAGLLHTTGDLVLTGWAAGRPMLSGTVDADTLPVPLPMPHSAIPWALDPMRALDAKVSLRAAHVLWGLSPFGEAATASIGLKDGVLTVDAIRGRIAGAPFAGRMELAASAPPRLVVSGTLSGAAIDGPLFGSPIDLVSGQADLTIDVAGRGYSPAGVLAMLGGTVKAAARNGSLAGIDGAGLVAALQAARASPSAAAVPAPVLDALRGGATAFTGMELAGVVANGVLSLQHGEVLAPSGPVTLSGSVDLTGDSVDLQLTIRPALDDPPAGSWPLGVRLIGPAGAPRRTPLTAGLTAWLSPP